MQFLGDVILPKLARRGLPDCRGGCVNFLENTMGLTVLKVEVGNPANPEVTEGADSNHRNQEV
jgi:hypothetical protein